MTRAGRPVAVLAIAVAAVSLLAIPAAAQQASFERPFISGSLVRMDLSAGDYTLQAGRDDRILVRWETRSAMPSRSRMAPSMTKPAPVVFQM